VSPAARDGAERLREAFRVCAGEGRAAFVPYLTANFPDGERALAAARALLPHADVLEIGLPFSDPLGDGPTIQRASEAALRAGTRSADVLALVAALASESSVPVVVMTYYNPIYRYHGPGGEGERGFVADVADAGAAGLILPDLPPDEGASLIEACRERGLGTVFLVAPTSTDARLELVTAACRGFVYAVSVTGVTGARDAVSSEVAELVRRTKAFTDLPVAVGFGVSTPEGAAQIAAHADGVVVGSKLVQTIADGGDVGAVAALLAGACRRGAVQSSETSTSGPRAR
jgi:tryptophan synthase alpha chain